MARPRRPDAEAHAVREAAKIVRAETGLTSAKGIGGEIAARVVPAVMREIEGDALELALAAIERDLIGSPFQRLASCPEIDTASLFVERQVERLRARSGRYLSPTEQLVERQTIAAEVTDVLAARYDRQLRAC
ncbi:hypothetical protein H9L14_01975 [Sphingomonas sediminicola]|uniref:Uncharacterized protein n=1 Tax=Sphingomonas sediminicola TaxID=386874 RepID=A0ABX6TAP4_9SPHN|nr:hypothetical protein [Sphingomonas sediminicola]QNP46065.1 hypothetical protein H9L14_01975 [Sphingomonas sediminicola]